MNGGRVSSKDLAWFFDQIPALLFNHVLLVTIGGDFNLRLRCNCAWYLCTDNPYAPDIVTYNKTRGVA